MSRNSRRGVLAVTVCAALAWATLSARAAEPAVLANVPDDAQVVFVVKDMKALSAKLNNTATRMGLPVPPDLLGALAQKMGFTKGLDQNGALAIMLVAAPKDAPAAPGDKPPMVLLVPTTDAKVMLERFKPKALEGGISEVTLPNEDEDIGYAAPVDKYVAFAETKSVLTGFLTHKGALNKTLSPEALKAFENNDAVLYANAALAADKAVESIDEAKDGLGMMMMMGAGAVGGDQAIFTQEILNGYFTAAKAIVSQSQTGMVTLRLSDAGATLGFVGRFKDESTLGKLVAAQKGVKSPDLTGLPAGDVLFAGAAGWDAASATAFAKKASDEFLASPKLQKVESYPQFKKMVDFELQMMGQLNALKFALYTPLDTTKGWINMVAISDVTDAAKYQAQVIQMMRDSKMMNAATMNPDLKFEVATKEKALTVKGVEFTKFTETFSAREATEEKPLKPETEQAVEIIKKMYGAEGLVVYLGAISPKQLLMVMGGDEKLMEKAVIAAQTNSDAVTKIPELAASAKEALPNALVVTYLPVDRWITLAKKQFGMDHGAREKDAGAVAIGGLPGPAVVSVSANGSTVTTEIHVPISLLISVTNSIQDAMSQQMTPPPPPPAPLGPGQ